MDRRILLILRTPPPYGGGEIMALTLKEGLGDRFDVLEISRKNHSKDKQGKYTTGNVLFGLHYIWTVSRAIVVRRPKVIFIDLPKDFPSFMRTSVILICAFILGVRVVGDLPGANFPFLERSSLSRAYGLMILRRLARIRVLSDSLQRTLASRGVTNTVSISNGIPAPPLSAESRPELGETIRCLYVGKVSARKGILTIVDFAYAFQQNCKGDFHIDVVGEWEDAATQSSVIRTIMDRGLQPHFTFHGLLTGDAKWRVYSSAHLLMHPSYWDGQPVTILEALAFGVPVIATRVGAIPDTLRHGVDGYLMEENSGTELLRGVEAIAGGRDTYRRYAEAAKAAFMSRYQLDLFLTRIARLLVSQT